MDHLTNLPDNPKETQPDKEEELESFKQASLFDIITLYGRTIRNSEDILITDKKEHLKYCFLGYIVLLAMFKEELENAVKEIESDNTGDSKESITKLENLIKLTIPFVLQNIAFESIGSGKLEETLTQLIREEENDFIRFMMVFLYADLKLDNYLISIKSLITSTKNKDILFLIKAKLQIYYMINHSPNKKELINLASEAELKVNNLSGKHKLKIMKSIDKNLQKAVRSL